MAVTPDYKTYLESILQTYERWSNLYTLTDTLGKAEVNMPLMAQLIPSKQDEQTPSGNKQEKNERLPVLEAIRKYASEHILLVGKPGSGKSTALQRLLWEEASKNCASEEGWSAGIIPVLVELRSWLPETASVIKLIQKVFRQNRLRLDEREIEDLLFDGKLLLLLDGLNELPSDESRRMVAEFRSDFPQTPMIFTTRNLAIGGDLGIKKQLSMQPLTEKQMCQFVRAYLPKQGEKMLQQLGDKLRELGETPLILKMLCDVFDKEKQIPNSRGGLFRYFDKEFDKLKGQVAVTDKLRQWKPELLQHLAFAMMQGEKITDLRLVISRMQAEDILEESLKNRINSPGEKAKDWLQDLLKHYLIQTVDGEQIQFHHQLFQEYYAAEYLLRLLPKLSNEKLKRDYLNLLKWTEPLALTLALLDDETQARRVLQLALDVDLKLVARLAEEVNSNFKEKTTSFIKQLKNLQGCKDWLSSISLQGIRNERQEYEGHQLEIRGYAGASFYLGDDGIPVIDFRQSNQIVNKENYKPGNIVYEYKRTHDEELLVPILQDLKNEDWYIRFDAARTLGEIGSESAIDELSQAYKAEQLFEFPFIVCIAIIRALGEIGSEKAIPTLREALINGENIAVRNGAVNALLKIESDAVVPILIEALKDEDWYIRESVVEALGIVGNEKAISPLQNTFNDPQYSVIWRVAEALNLIQERCKFYNYEIFHSPRIEESSQTDLQSSQSITHIFNAPVGNVNTGVVNNQGNQVGIQNNEQTQ
ncbi:HEAT repeat domain-containing protein [Calothrix sp. PCC 6303]|uniref:HEAT repeat domain-containing protein n=1 Tax=Calothrix sp. PCC 6303 TaxID=1170562 RepID=UPI0002A014CE|nr:HEAT repeat domain-containing protein [Calothrix sp. PCC 6303]AFZ04644.1 putative signal transduction protein with Nacht domain [Calothrix sp. PCC 6303]